MSDSTGETESTTGAPSVAETAESGDGAAVGESADSTTEAAAGGSAATENDADNDSLPDLSDIAGATTGPLTLPKPEDGDAPQADAAKPGADSGASNGGEADPAELDEVAADSLDADGIKPDVPPSDSTASDSTASDSTASDSTASDSTASEPAAPDASADEADEPTSHDGANSAANNEAATAPVAPAPTGEIQLDAAADGEATSAPATWAAPSAESIKESAAGPSTPDSPAAPAAEATVVDGFVPQPPPPTAADAIKPAAGTVPAVTGQITAEELAAAQPPKADDSPPSPTDGGPDKAEADKAEVDKPEPNEAEVKAEADGKANDDKPDGGKVAVDDDKTDDGKVGTDKSDEGDSAFDANATVAVSPITASPTAPSNAPAPETQIVSPAPDTELVADATVPPTSPPSPDVPPPPPPGTDETVSLPIADATSVLPIQQASPPTADPDATQLVPETPSQEAPGKVGETSTSDAAGSEAAPSVAMANATNAALQQPSPPAEAKPTVDPTSDIVLQPGKQKRHRLRNGILVAAGLVALFLGAWAFDSVRSSDQVLRNTSLGSTPIGGLTESELGDVIDDLDAELADAPLTVAVGDASIDTDAASLGARLDRDAITEEALDFGRDGNLLMRPFKWIGSFGSSQRLEPSYMVDAAASEAAVESVITNALEAPQEPTIELRGSNLALVGGSEGETVDVEQLRELLPAELASDAPYSIALEPVATSPELSDEQVQTIVDEASEATAEPVIFRVLDQTTEVTPTELRSWVRLDTEGAEPTWIIDEQASADYLKPQFPALGSEDQQASFNIVNNEPIIIPAAETVICCDDESIGEVRSALLEPLPPPPTNDEDEDGTDDEGEEVEPALRVIGLEPEIVGQDEGVAELESLGIIEEVSSFTTNHPCCANRVINIQRFADLMRGVIIRPGEDFSLNGHVGRRTIENGFAADSAIANGILEPQVGGGISQFATTFFNASFFAGIEFNEYQSHSLFISRYPRGREATISFPRPDLSVKNTTEYGILVWTEYTPTSITVTFYSTKHIEVEALDLQRSSQGACTRYTTPRVRTFPDGEVLEDSVFAVYRPGEGLDCNGNSTRPEDQPAGPTLPGPEPDDAAPAPAPEPDDAAPAPAPEPAPQP